MIKYFNPNPTVKFFKSGNPKNWYVNDSAVRAVACALNLSWEESFSKLCDAAKELYDIPTSRQTIDKVLTDEGFQFVTLGKPSKGASRPIVKEFVGKYPDNVVVLNLADYFVTMKEDNIWDVSDKCLKSSIYSYWYKLSA